MVEGSGLENQRGASLRGFESHPLRHIKNKLSGIIAINICWAALEKSLRIVYTSLVSQTEWYSSG